MNKADLTRLRHMLEASQAALDFVKGEDRESLDKDLKLVFALYKAIEIIGEAAANISQETRQQLPQLPWISIIGMRNFLVHEYFDIDREKVWNTVTEDLPPLVAQLEKIIPPDDPVI